MFSKQIEKPINLTDRTYTLNISIINASSTIVNISQNGTITSSNFNGASINITVPANNNSYVEVS